MNLLLIYAVWAFWRTKRLDRTLRTRDELERWQEQRLNRFLSRVCRRVPFYAGQTAGAIKSLPVMDKAGVLANFERLNIKGIRLAEACQALDQKTERLRGLIIGQSTGTSGNRGVFVISDAERFTWLGVILAKTLPDFPGVRHKIALILPAYGELYRSASETGRLAIRFFDLATGIASWADDLEKFGPTTIVAPPKILVVLAERGGLHPRHVFSGAEVLDPVDRRIIEAGFGVILREIYMATEGLFGVSCPEGVLHLAEDVVAFEFEAVPGNPELLMPVVTDFTRTTQIMARYRMNDLLRLRDTPCPCGSPLKAVSEIVGRQDDVFRLDGGQNLVLATPDIIRNAVIDTDRRIQDFRVVQTGKNAITVSLSAELPQATATAAAAGLAAALQKLGAASVEIIVEQGMMNVPFDKKLRRVRRDWNPDTVSNGV